MIAPTNIVDQIKAASGEEQLQALRVLRNSLIGHDDEKLEHAQDDTIPTLLNIIVDQSAMEACRIEASILIASFAFGMYINELPLQKLTVLKARPRYWRPF